MRKNDRYMHDLLACGACVLTRSTYGLHTYVRTRPSIATSDHAALKYKAYLKGVWQAAKADNARNIMFTIDGTEKYEDVKSALLELRNDHAQVRRFSSCDI